MSRQFTGCSGMYAQKVPFGGPVHEFTKSTSPITAFEDENGDLTKIVGPRYPDELSIACGVTP